MSSKRAIVDTSYLVALIDERDSLHTNAKPLRDWLETHRIKLILLDVLVGECVSVLARRCAERRQAEQLARVVTALESHFPPAHITWVGHEIRRHYPEILTEVRETEGRRNFNDALTILVARDLQVGAVVSFDPDFDGLPDLARVSSPETAARAWKG